MNVKELIAELQKLEAAGHGDAEVHVMQYMGGDYEPCDVKPTVPEYEGGPVMLETTSVPRW